MPVPNIVEQHQRGDGAEEPGVDPGDAAQHRVGRQPHHREDDAAALMPRTIAPTVAEHGALPQALDAPGSAA